MKKMNEKEKELFLSQYVDNLLSEKEMLKAESLLQKDESARNQVQELMNLKSLLSANKKLSPDIGFMTRFSMLLEDEKKDERSFLPFPRRYMPAVTVLSAVAVVFIGALIIQNRTDVLRFISVKTDSVQNVYDKNLLKGSLMPLFGKVDKDRALEFSLFGKLALDEKSQTSLRVDEQLEKGYRIEVGKDTKSGRRPMTFDRFVEEVKPTNEQKRIIDSLLELTGKRIESSVLIGDNNSMAIAPDLPKLNRIMVANIASCLEPRQQVSFRRLLENNDAPYTVNVGTVLGKQGRDLETISKSPQGDRFVIVTPDTMMYSRIQVNFDSLRKRMEGDFAMIRDRREAMIRKMMAREFRYMQQRDSAGQYPVNVINGDEFFSIEITSPAKENQSQQMHVIIQPRLRKKPASPDRQESSFRIQVHEDTVVSGEKPRE